MTAARFRSDTLEITARAVGASDSPLLWRHYIVKLGESELGTRMDYFGRGQVRSPQQLTSRGKRTRATRAKY